MDNVQKIKLVVSVFLGLVVEATIFGLVLAFPIMWCWNHAITAMWHLPSITWGQAWCLNFLCSVLFKSNFNAITRLVTATKRLPADTVR